MQTRQILATTFCLSLIIVLSTSVGVAQEASPSFGLKITMKAPESNV